MEGTRNVTKKPVAMVRTIDFPATPAWVTKRTPMPPAAIGLKSDLWFRDHELGDFAGSHDCHRRRLENILKEVA